LGFIKLFTMGGFASVNYCQADRPGAGLWLGGLSCGQGGRQSQGGMIGGGTGRGQELKKNGQR